MVSQTSSVIRAVNCRQQLLKNIAHRLFAINLDQPAAFTVVINQRRGGAFVLFKSSDHRLRVIVTPLEEFRAIRKIADQALRDVLQRPFGPTLLLLIAAGLGCYGLFCFAWARHLSR